MLARARSPRSALVAAVGAVLVAATAAGAAGRIANGPVLVETASRSGATKLVVVDGSKRAAVATTGTFIDGPAWSPDGAWLAYVSEAKDKSVSLWVQRFDVPDRRRIALAPVACPGTSCAAISYAWGPADELAVAFADAGGWHLQVRGLDGSLLRELSPRRAPDVTYRNVSWSPDGRWIGFTRYAGVEGTAGCCVNEYDVVRPDGTALRTVFKAADPIHDTPVVRWSPDGTRLALATEARATADPALAILDVPAGNLHRLRRFAGGTVPAWSPDGQSIAFSALVPLRGGLFMRRLVVADTSGKPERMLAAPGSLVDVTWAPDGTRLLVTVAPGPDAAANEVDVLRTTGGPASTVYRVGRASAIRDAEWAPRS